MIGRKSILTLVFLVTAAACGSSGGAGTTTTAGQTTATNAATTTASSEPGGEFGEDGSGLRIGAVFHGPVLDGGWNESHSAAMERTKELYPGIEITRIDGADPGQKAQRAFEDLASQGNQLVWGAASSYPADALAVAEAYPDTNFAAVAGGEVLPNVAQYFGATYQAHYLHGLLAGMLTKSNTIGYLSGFPLPVVQGDLNAVAIAAHEVNPDAKVEYLYVNSWYDPDLEFEAVRTLFESGADVIVSGMSSPAVGSFADREGLLWMGYDGDFSDVNPQSWVSGFHILWDAYYKESVADMIAGTWEGAVFYGGYGEGMLTEANYGPAVTAEMLEVVEAKRQAMIDGTFHVFEGPLMDTEGNERVPAGTALESAEIYFCCDWLVSYLGQ